MIVGLAAIIIPAFVRIFVAYMFLYVFFYMMLVGLGLAAVLSGEVVVAAAVLLVLMWPRIREPLYRRVFS